MNTAPQLHLFHSPTCSLCEDSGTDVLGENCGGRLGKPGRWPVRDLRCLTSLVIDNMRDGLSEVVRAFRCNRIPGPRARVLLIVLANIPTDDLPDYHLYWVHRARAMLAADDLRPIKKVNPDEKGTRKLRSLGSRLPEHRSRVLSIKGHRG